MRALADRKRLLAAFLITIGGLLCGCNCTYVIHARVLEGPTSGFEVVALGSAPAQGQPIEGAGVRFWPGDPASDEQGRHPARLTGTDGTIPPEPLVVKSLSPIFCSDHQAVSFECDKPGYQRVDGTLDAHRGGDQVVVIHMAPAAGEGQVVAFGGGALQGLKAGAGYVYRLVVDKGYHSPAGAPPERGTDTHYVRVLLTDVQQRGGAVEVKGRLDKLDNRGRLLHDDLYRFTLTARDDGSEATLVAASSVSGPGVLGLVDGVPCFLLGYPNFGGIPKYTPAEPVVRTRMAGAMVGRLTPTYNADAGSVELSIERFRYANEDEAARGRRVLYWVKDAGALSPTVPAGQEAAPMYVTGIGFPRDKYGDPERYNVRPVVANEWETQVWEPGAPFPKEIRVSAPESGGGYVARLLAVQQLTPGRAPTGMERGWAVSGEGRGWADGGG